MDEKILQNWNKMKGHLKREYASLSNNDVTRRTGKDEEMFDNIQLKTGLSREELTVFLTGVLAM